MAARRRGTLRTTPAKAVIQSLSSRDGGRHHLGGRFRLFRLPHSLTANSAPRSSHETAAAGQIKMVELKLSQGAKPGHGGVLPAAKVSPRNHEDHGASSMGKDCISPSSHSVFSTPIELVKFIGEMRRLSGGKPAGFRALHRTSLGVPRNMQGHAWGSQCLSGFHRHRRERGRHRRSSA